MRLLVLSFVILFCGCNNVTDSAAYNDVKLKDADSATLGVDKKDPRLLWTYYDKEDPMTSKKVYYATLLASEKLELPFPYDGTQYPQFLIRHKNGTSEVMLIVTKGQFNSGSSGGNILVRFDTAKPVTFPYARSSDNSSNCIFIDNEKAFLKRLKGTKRLLVQAEFYSAGVRTMTFDAEGFKWNH